MKPGPKRQIRVDPETGCHVPVRHAHPSGYHHYKMDGRKMQAARVVWIEAHGSIPEGLTIDHLCRNRACVNVDHLEPVTCAENIRRSPRVKLTWEAVRAIRASEEPGRALAKRYNVSDALISLVRSGQIWRELKSQRELGG